MELDELYRVVKKISGPFLLIASPLLGAMVLNAYFRDKAAGIEIPFSGKDAFLILGIVGGTIMGIYFCREAYGWFGGKK